MATKETAQPETTRILNNADRFFEWRFGENPPTTATYAHCKEIVDKENPKRHIVNIRATTGQRETDNLFGYSFQILFENGPPVDGTFKFPGEIIKFQHVYSVKGLPGFIETKTVAPVAGEITLKFESNGVIVTGGGSAEFKASGIRTQPTFAFNLLKLLGE
jgi:hypothetical protein